MTDHGYFEELITAGLDGELSEAEAEELRAHLEGCQQCRSFKAAMEAVAGLTDRDLPAPPPALKENVMAAVRANPPEKKKGRILSFPLRSIAAAAALALVLWAGARVILPKGSAGSAGVQMSMAAGSADAAKAEDAGDLRTGGMEDAAFDVYNGTLEAAPAAEAPAECPEPEECADEVCYVIFAGGEELFTAAGSALPEGLLAPAKPFPVPNREPDWTVQADAPEGERPTWLLWEEDGTVIVQTPEGDTGYSVSAEVFRAFLEQ